MLLTRDLELFQVLRYICSNLATYIPIEGSILGTTLDPKVNIDFPGYSHVCARSSIWKNVVLSWSYTALQDNMYQ